VEVGGILGVARADFRCQVEEGDEARPEVGQLVTELEDRALTPWPVGRVAVDDHELAEPRGVRPSAELGHHADHGRGVQRQRPRPPIRVPEWIEKAPGEVGLIPGQPDFTFKREGGQLLLIRVPGG
jgi:hypothetical protein